MSVAALVEERLKDRPRRGIRRAHRAAVLVPIVEDGGPERLILTRRSPDLATHQGQVAFPGGHIEPGDDGPAAAALREAQEEIGLPPSAVDILGLLDDFTTWDDRVAVTSVAARLTRVPPLAPRASEVDRIFEIPVAELARPGRWTSRLTTERQPPRRLYYFEHDGEILWGLSARIVIHLLELAGLPTPLPAAGSA